MFVGTLAGLPANHLLLLAVGLLTVFTVLVLCLRRQTPVTYKYFLREKTGGHVRWEDAIPERLLPVHEQGAAAPGVGSRGAGDGGAAGAGKVEEIVVEDGTFNEADDASGHTSLNPKP